MTEIAHQQQILSVSGILGPSAGILELFMGARNRVGIGLSYRPAMLQRLAESFP